MPNPDPATRRPRARAPSRGSLAPRLLLALLAPGPVLGALGALTGSPALREAAAALAARALIAGPLLAIALLILATVTTSDGAPGDEPTTPDAA